MKSPAVIAIEMMIQDCDSRDINLGDDMERFGATLGIVIRRGILNETLAAIKLAEDIAKIEAQ